jgi:hypothetical protein
MKGAATALLVILLAGLAAGNPPIKEPLQFEQACNNLKVAGTGIIDVSNIMVDKRIALQYSSALAGDGSLELDSERVLSEIARKVKRDLGLNNSSALNLFEEEKITYSGETPLSGDKLLHSKAFYGGIGSQVRETFSVQEMEGELKSYMGETATASGAHLLGMDTKSAFNGTWGTETSWHKIFDKSIESRQTLSGKFEVDRKTKLHEKAIYNSKLECKKTGRYSSSRTLEYPYGYIDYEYEVANPSETVISDLTLADDVLGNIPLDKAVLNPEEIAYGYGRYGVDAIDFDNGLGFGDGSKENTATASGEDNLGQEVNAGCEALVEFNLPAQSYSGTVLTPGCTNQTPPGVALAAAAPCASCQVCSDSFNLKNGSLIIYALDVNMSQSRYPPPDCPFHGWPDVEGYAAVYFGITSNSSISSVPPWSSAWQSLSLLPGFYQARQAYKDADGNTGAGNLANWSSTYAGTKPNGGMHCTGDPGFDTFDLKLMVTDLGPGEGLQVDAYQRIHNSTEPMEPALSWQAIGSQQVPAEAIDKSSLFPLVMVAGAGTAGPSISWSEVVVLP